MYSVWQTTKAHACCFKSLPFFFCATSNSSEYPNLLIFPVICHMFRLLDRCQHCQSCECSYILMNTKVSTVWHLSCQTPILIRVQQFISLCSALSYHAYCLSYCTLTFQCCTLMLITTLLDFLFVLVLLLWYLALILVNILSAQLLLKQGLNSRHLKLVLAPVTWASKKMRWSSEWQDVCNWNEELSGASTSGSHSQKIYNSVYVSWFLQCYSSCWFNSGI